MATKTSADVPVVGPRQPCPCGSGKRYKACHGKRARAPRYVARPFEGLASEGDWIALREIVPCATAPLRLAADESRDVIAATLLPNSEAALVRSSGQVLLGLQTTTSTGDASADLAHALTSALDAEPGAPVNPGPRDEGGPRLQDLLVPSAPLEVAVHEGFDFWLESDDDATPAVRALLEQANEAAIPTSRLASVDAAYWCRFGDRDQLRWVLSHDEEPLLDGLARLHAAGDDLLGADSRLLGTFRAYGRLVAVWDVAPGSAAAELEQPAGELSQRLEAAVAESAPLTGEQRRARAGLANRQITVR